MTLNASWTAAATRIGKARALVDRLDAHAIEQGARRAFVVRPHNEQWPRSATGAAIRMGKFDLPVNVVAAHLAELASRYGTGNVNALFMAIAFCGQQQVPLPEWVVAAYSAAMNRWWTLQCKTLDEAFGVAWPKSKQWAAAAKKTRLRFFVYADVENMRRRGRGISKALFAEVGRRCGISATTADEFYYSAKSTLESPKAFDALLVPFMTRAAKDKAVTRKVSKLAGSGSKRR